MKFKTGDEARVKRTNKETMYKHIEGTTVMIVSNFYGDLYTVCDCIGGRWILDEEMLEPVAIRSVLFPNVEYVFNEKQAEEYAERLNKELANHFNAFPNDGISAKNGGKNSMKFTFYTVEGYRMDKSNNTKIPTVTTEVVYKDKDGCATGGSATCDKADYNSRQGVLEALANMCCGGNFDREYNKAVKDNARADKISRTCTYCGQLFDTVAEKEAHEAWHVERKKARHERYLLRKRAKEIAFEEQAQKMAKEMMGEQK